MDILRRSRGAMAHAMAVTALAVVAVGCSDSVSSSARPRIVVTHEVLATVIRDLVHDDAVIDVVMPNGKDPHEFEVSARDIAKFDDASLIVMNGAGFEPRLVRPIHEAESRDVPVFDVSTHLNLHHSGSTPDPHYFLDPQTMLQMLPELAAAVANVVPTVDTTRVNEAVSDIKDADRKALAELSVLSPGQCQLITGHESLGYFAQRYSCSVLGTVVSGLSGEAEVSADHLVSLVRTARAARVRAVFVEEGTPASTAHTVARELGVSIVTLTTHSVPGNGTYSTYVAAIARTIAQALVVSS